MPCASQVYAMTEKPTTDPAERLANIRAAQAGEKSRSPNLLLRVGFPLLFAFAVFVYFLPDILSTQSADDYLLSRSKAYCKSMEPRDVCEAKIATRHEICRTKAQDADTAADVYGPCMEQVFADFYPTIAENLPKTATPF